jgi:hypothetical protein
LLCGDPIAAVQPVHVATWIEAGTRELAAPSVKQHLAAIAVCYAASSFPIERAPLVGGLRSEDWQSTLTRAPLFANLFFDRLAALGSRAVNARFWSLCFVALFDQVVDRRLVTYVPPMDTPC